MKTDASILAFAIGAFAGLALTAVSTTAAMLAVGLGAIFALTLVAEPRKTK
jgi:hypothetical protein